MPLDSKRIADSIMNDIKKIAEEQSQNELKPELEKQLNKIYYPDEIIVFEGSIYEVDELENKIIGSDFSVKKNQILPNFKTPFGAGYRDEDTKVNLNVIFD